MKKISATHPDSPHGEKHYEKLYEYLNAALIGKLQSVVEAFGEEFITSLLQRCGLGEVIPFSKDKNRTTISLPRTIVFTFSKGIQTEIC